MLRLGWQVFRSRFREDLSLTRVRRALVVGLVVSAVTAVVLGLTAVWTSWPGGGTGGSSVVVALCALAAGLIAMSCFPVQQTADPPATINGRQVRPDTMRLGRDSVQRYLGRRMPEVQLEDRAAVLHDTVLIRRTLVVDVARITPGLTGVALLALASVVALEWQRVGLIGLIGYIGLIPTTITRLGRTERAHRAAAALPPAEPVTTTPAGRNRFPSGSKIDLPGN